MAIALLIALFGQSGEGKESIYDVKYKYEAKLKAISGVVDVSIGGVNGNLMLIVRVAGNGADEEVRQFAKGGLDGFKVHVQVSTPSTPPKKVDEPADKSLKVLKEQLDKNEKIFKSPTAAIVVPEDRDNVWKASVVDCDIVRQYLQMKEIDHPIGNGYSEHPCKLVLRGVQGTYGGFSYVYTKHRSRCPIRLGRVAQPSWADNYLAWIFQKGFNPVMRGGFLWPTELRGDDRRWAKSATEDLMTRLPFIREGAEWEKFPTERPGLGWTWKSPTTSIGSGATPVPTGGQK